jgi:hypothetical protein
MKTRVKIGMLFALVSTIVAAPIPACADATDLHSARLEPSVCWYDGSKLRLQKPFVNGQLDAEASHWTCKQQTTPVPGASDAVDYAFTFKLTEGTAQQAGVAVTLRCDDWSADNYVLIPGSVYNGNRTRVVPRGYASGLDRSDLYRKDLSLTTCELPQLSPEPGKSSRLEVSVCNATTPAMCAFDRKAKRGFILLTDQGIRRGRKGEILDYGLSIEESPDRKHAAFIVSAPCVRPRKPEFIGFSPSPDRGIAWKAGDEITLRLRLDSFATPDIAGLLDRFVSVRKAVTGPNHPRNLVPFSETARRMTSRIDSRFHSGKPYSFYCPENADWISFGWIGGLMDTYPMLALGDGMHLRRVTETFDFAIPRAQGNAGYYFGLLTKDGHAQGREGYDDHPEICLTRKNGDVLFWMIKQFELLKAQKRADAINPRWEQSMRRLADAFVATWKRHRQWGNFVNVDTGDVAVYNTTGGAMAVGGLALAADYFHNPEYLDIAKQAAQFYYDRDVLGLGLTTGGCADILQNADSETAAGFMTSLMALYDTTGDRQWLEKSRTLANLAATWVVSYDYELPPNTELARLGAKLAGAVWASTQNKHGAPGFCTSSGDPLLKIYRATGDRRYAELLRDVIHAHAEGMRSDGRITERLTYCDADSRGTIGGGSNGWTELNGFLMALEIPGVYLRTDSGDIYVFDHVEARVVKRGDDAVTLKLTNPTDFSASVAIFAESAAQTARPLGYNTFLRWPHVDLRPRESVHVTINRDGQVLSAAQTSDP